MKNQWKTIDFHDFPMCRIDSLSVLSEVSLGAAGAFGGMNEGALKRIFKDEEKEAGQVLPRKSCRSFQKCIICLPERPSQVQCIA